jgi:hypothetical protein
MEEKVATESNTDPTMVVTEEMETTEERKEEKADTVRLESTRIMEKKLATLAMKVYSVS